MCEDVKQAASQEAVAYLDIGAGGYIDLGSNLSEAQLTALPKGRHALAIVGTYGIDGYVPAPVAAAPGIDHLRSVINALSRSISDAYEKACQNGDERMQTLQNARQSLLNTIREAMPPADASPKGVNDSQDAARWRYTQQEGYFATGPISTDGDFLEYSVGVLEYVYDKSAHFSEYRRQLPLSRCIKGCGNTLAEAIDAAMLATSAEVTNA